jgi:hypothetical protein
MEDAWIFWTVMETDWIQISHNSRLVSAHLSVLFMSSEVIWWIHLCPRFEPRFEHDKPTLLKKLTVQKLTGDMVVAFCNISIFPFHNRPAVSLPISLSWCDVTDIISNTKKLSLTQIQFHNLMIASKTRRSDITSYTRGPRHAMTWIQANQLTHDCKTLELATFLWRIAIERVLLPNPVYGWVGKFLSKNWPWTSQSAWRRSTMD